MEAYEVKTSDGHYLVIASSWNEAARAADHPDTKVIQITRMTGSEANFPILLIANEL